MGEGLVNKALRSYPFYVCFFLVYRTGWLLEGSGCFVLTSQGAAFFWVLIRGEGKGERGKGGKGERGKGGKGERGKGGRGGGVYM